ncbi:MAG: ribosome-associated translation inhibitor RaiA [Oscillospiraceae bacterium]|nr:ribosome-associated translation inhibitor RaiA [Oscillospiraceae bacterium]
MKFQFSEKKVRLPQNVHAYAEKKVMKLARYFEEDAEALIVFSVEKGRNKAELTVHGADHWFRASESTSDMFASIDAAVGTIEGQIRKNKTRLARRLRQDAFSRTVEATSFALEEPEENLDIVRAKSFYFKPMTREEAVLQMNLLEHSFFAFRDEDNGGSFAVVYRRNDGGYGLIDDAG